MQAATSSKPNFSKRLGFVEVAGWVKKLDSGMVVYDFKPSCSYKDKEGNWKHTGNFSSGDLGNVIKLLQEAQGWVLGQG